MTAIHPLTRLNPLQSCPRDRLLTVTLILIFTENEMSGGKYIRSSVRTPLTLPPLEISHSSVDRGDGSRCANSPASPLHKFPPAHSRSDKICHLPAFGPHLLLDLICQAMRFIRIIFAYWKRSFPATVEIRPWCI